MNARHRNGSLPSPAVCAAVSEDNTPRHSTNHTRTYSSFKTISSAAIAAAAADDTNADSATPSLDGSIELNDVIVFLRKSQSAPCLELSQRQACENARCARARVRMGGAGGAGGSATFSTDWLDSLIAADDFGNVASVSEMDAIVECHGCESGSLTSSSRDVDTVGAMMTGGTPCDVCDPQDFNDDTCLSLDQAMATKYLRNRINSKDFTFDSIYRLTLADDDARTDGFHLADSDVTSSINLSATDAVVDCDRNASKECGMETEVSTSCRNSGDLPEVGVCNSNVNNNSNSFYLDPDAAALDELSIDSDTRDDCPEIHVDKISEYDTVDGPAPNFTNIRKGYNALLVFMHDLQRDIEGEVAEEIHRNPRVLSRQRNVAIASREGSPMPDGVARVRGVQCATQMLDTAACDVTVTDDCSDNQIQLRECHFTALELADCSIDDVDMTSVPTESVESTDTDESNSSCGEGHDKVDLHSAPRSVSDSAAALEDSYEYFRAQFKLLENNNFMPPDLDTVAAYRHTKHRTLPAIFHSSASHRSSTLSLPTSKSAKSFAGFRKSPKLFRKRAKRKEPNVPTCTTIVDSVHNTDVTTADTDPASTRRDRTDSAHSIPSANDEYDEVDACGSYSLLQATRNTPPTRSRLRGLFGKRNSEPTLTSFNSRKGGFEKKQTSLEMLKSRFGYSGKPKYAFHLDGFGFRAPKAAFSLYQFTGKGAGGVGGRGHVRSAGDRAKSSVSV